MSSAARFLLEFEATGDQEVVAKIKAVGAAGKQTATDLESLRGIEDPFEPIATGADAAVAPIEGVGTAAEGAVTPLGELGTTAEEGVTALTDIGSAADTAVTPIEGVGTATEGLGGIFSGAGTEAETFGGAMDAIGGNAEAATGGLTDANTVVGDFGDAASTSADQSAGFGDTVKGMSGSIVAIGGAIGGAVSAFFRYQDAQLKVQKAQNAVARANEAVRKTTENIQAILATATSNTDAIAAANTRYVAAQARVNQLQREGITSGEEYNAANKELQDSQAALSAELAKGGGDAKKLTNEMNKLEIQEGKAATQAATLEKANRQSNQTIMDGVLQAATLAGSIVQIGQGMAKTAGPIGKMTMGLRGLSGALTAVTGVGLGGLTAALGIGAAAVGVFMGAVLALSKAPYDLIIGKFDQLGKKMGETFPGLKDALQSTGDAFRSSLSFLAKGTTDTIKALTGLDLESKIVGKSFSDLVTEFMKLGTVGVPEVDAALKSFIETGKKAGLTDKEIIELAKEHNAEFEKVANTTKLAGVSHGLFAGAVVEATAALKENATQTDLQSAAINKLIGPTTTLNAELAVMTGEVNKLTQADADSVAATESKNRAMIIANAGFNNAVVAAIQYQQALTAQTQELVTSTDANNANAAAILTLADSELNAREAISQVNLAYANSVDKLADLNAVMGDSEAMTKAVATAANEFTASLKEENIELQGNLQGLQDVENQQQGVQNAILQTKVSLEESNQALREAKAVHDDMGASMAQLQTALNEEQTALIEEEAALQASIAATMDNEIQTKKLANAKLQGQAAAVEFIAALDEEREAAQANMEILQSVVSELGVFGDATVQSKEQLENFLGVFTGSPAAIDELAKSIGGLAQEATKFLEFAGEDNELFGNWELAEDLPDEIANLMSESDRAFIEGRAQLERSMESLGPLVGVKFARAIQQGGGAALEELRKFGPEAADIIRQSGAEMDPAVQELVYAFDALANVTDANVVPAMARVVTAMENVKDPAAGLGENLAKMANEGQISTETLRGLAEQGIISGDVLAQAAKSVEGLAESTAGSTQGLNDLFGAMDSVAGAGKTLVLDFEKLNKVVIDGVGTFVQVGDQLLKVPGQADAAAGGLAQIDVNATAAATKLQALHTVLTLLPQVEVAPKINVDATEAANKIQATKTALEILNNATVIPKIDVDASAAASKIQATVSALQILQNATIIVTITANTTQAVSSLNAASNAALTMRNNFNAASSGVKSAVASAGAAVTSFSSKASSSFAKAGAAGTQMANKVKSASSSMKSSLSSAASSAASFASKCVSSFNKVGSSATSNASKVRSLASAINNLKSKTITITTRYVTSGRPTRGGLQHGGAFIADSPTTIGGTKVGEHYKPELVTVTPLTNPNNLDRTITVNTPRTGGGGSREVVIPVTLMLDNKVLIRTVRRGLVEEVSGTM